MGEVVKLKLPDDSNMSVTRVKEIVEKTDFSKLLVIGYDEDGYLISINSSMTNAEVLWLLKGAEKILFDL